MDKNTGKKKSTIELQISHAVTNKVAEFCQTYTAPNFEDAMREKAALLIPFLVQKEFDKAVSAHITQLVRKQIGDMLK